MSRKTKSIISGIVLVALIAGVLALAVSWLGKDTKSISSTEFAVGAINAEGVYVKNDQSIYTKDLIECQGLSIEPDFEATGTYQVFYYGEDKNFIGATDPINAEDGVYNKASTFPLAKYCRIMITPDIPTDEDGYVEEDFKIRFYEVAGYANDYNITVDKKQTFNEVTSNLWVKSETMGTDNFYTINEGVAFDTYSTTTAETFCNSELIDVTGYKKLVIVADFDTLKGVNYYTWTASKTLVEYLPLDIDSENVDVTVSGNTATYVFELDRNVSYVSFSLKQLTGVVASGVEIYAIK